MRSATIVALLLTAAPLAAQTPPDSTATDPCLDRQYLELKARDLDEMTEREYAYFMQRDQACTEYRRSSVVVEGVSAQTGKTIAAAGMVMVTVIMAVVGFLAF